jgi:uncharacterized protein GlcG (DUF336 family)
VVVVDPYGLVVHEHRMDGEGWIQVNATEQKARTALRTRAPSHVLTNRNVQDPFTNQNMAGYGLTTQEGGLPIIVNGQLIGAIGVGGIPPAERTATYGEEMCARDALEAVIGPQPPLLPELAAQRNNPAGARGRRREPLNRQPAGPARIAGGSPRDGSHPCMAQSFYCAAWRGRAHCAFGKVVGAIRRLRPTNSRACARRGTWNGRICFLPEPDTAGSPFWAENRIPRFIKVV